PVSHRRTNRNARPRMIVEQLEDRLVPASVLSGFVYSDLSNDGAKQAGEAGISGVTVRLTSTDNQSPVSLTTTTSPTGAYSFSVTRPGTYRLTATQPPNYLDGKATAGNLGGTAGPNTLSDVVVGNGSNGSGYNFGELAPSSLAGFVYADANDDGVQGT